MASLSQINMQFLAADDRLLLLLKTDELAEFRFWMTRRFVKSLWPALVQCLAANDTVRAQTLGDDKRTVLSFQHESAISRSNFDTPYDANVVSTPLGKVPLLLTRATVKRTEAARPVLGLYPAEGRGIELALDEGMLHSFCRLLAKSVDKTGWDLNLALSDAGRHATPSATVN